MELSSNAQITNMMSSLTITHFLNLTYPRSGNVTSWLTSSTSATTMTATSGPTSLSQSVETHDRGNRNDNSEVEILEMFNKYFTKVIDPVIIATGIVSNALLAIVFIITQLRLRPLSHVLSGLGVVDLMYMLSYMLMYLTKQGVNVYGVPAACQVINFTLMLSKSMEAWCILMSHLDRLKAHKSARSEKRVFPTKFATFMIGLLVAAPLLHILWSTETVTIASTTYCVPMREAIFVHLTLRKIEMISTVLLPLALIAGVDCMLLVRVITYYTTKKDPQDAKEREKKLSCSSTSSCLDKNILASLQKEDASKEKQLEENVNGDIKLLSEDKGLTLAFQIAYHLVKETSCHYDSRVEDAQNTGQDLSLNSDEKTFMNLPKIISQNTSQFDNNSSHLSTLVFENDAAIRACNRRLSTSKNEECNRRLSTSKNEECNSRKSSISRIPESVHNDLSPSRPESGIYLYRNCSEINVNSLRKDSSEQDERGILCNSNTKTLVQSKNAIKAKFIVPSFVLNGIKKCKLNTGAGLSKENNCKREFSKNSNIQVNSENSNNTSIQVNSENSNNTSIQVNNENSFNTSIASQGGRYSTQLSSLPQTHATREDQTLPIDSTAATIATVILGLVFAITILPSTYTQAVRLFLESPTTRPTAKSVQTAILFESFVQINAFYKLFMYALVMPSFRSAMMWLLNHWIRNKVTSISSLCLWGSESKKTEAVYV